MARVPTFGLVAALALPLTMGVRFAEATNLSELTIVGVGTGAVEGPINVYFNPKEYTITKSTPWKHHDIQGLDAPTLEFTSGEPYRCEFELFFDRYEEGKSVREITDKVETLAKPRPGTDRPLVRVTWGGAEWTTYLLGATTKILDVAPDGTPLAASVLTLWSAFDEAGAVPPSPDPVPVVFTTKGGPVPATLDGASIDLLTLKKGDVVKSQAVVPHEVQGLSPRVDFRAGDPQRLRCAFDLDGGGKDVRAEIERLVAETSSTLLIDLRADGTGLAFKCILESFSLRFTLFLDDGTPVRAVMNTTWKEFSPAEEQLKGNPRH
jgi:hypothetical protein